jgi:hypothetical protein
MKYVNNKNTSGDVIGNVEADQYRDIYGNWVYSIVTGNLTEDRIIDTYGNWVAEIRGDRIYNTYG